MHWQSVQVARAVEQMLGDEEGQAEQMVAVLDARQATTLQVTRKVNLIKQLALDLNQVCPATHPRPASNLPKHQLRLLPLQCLTSSHVLFMPKHFLRSSAPPLAHPA